jgi:hypothetical protein
MITTIPVIQCRSGRSLQQQKSTVNVFGAKRPQRERSAQGNRRPDAPEKDGRMGRRGAEKHPPKPKARRQKQKIGADTSWPCMFLSVCGGRLWVLSLFGGMPVPRGGGGGGRRRETDIAQKWTTKAYTMHHAEKRVRVCVCVVFVCVFVGGCGCGVGAVWVRVCVFAFPR